MQRQTPARGAARSRLFAATAIVFIAGHGGAAMAQKAPAAAGASAAPSAVDEVVVTGSRIKGVAPIGSSPITIGNDEIVKRGMNTTTEILRDLPQIAALGATEAGSSVQGAAANITRGNGINLRGLGPASTLTLFNSRRVVAQGAMGQLIDVSTFPTLAVERIEVVGDGASAIYGSDAVAGVINILPRTRFNGLQVRARYGAAEGGYDERMLSGIVGKTWDGGHVMASLEYSDHDFLFAADRDFITSDQRARGGVDNRSFNCNPGNLIVGGVFYRLPAGNNRPTAAQLVRAPVSTTDANRCDNTKFGMTLPQTKRIGGLASASQQLSDRVEWFVEAFGTKRQTRQRSSPVELSNVALPTTNAFFINPAAGAVTVDTQLPEFGVFYSTAKASGYQATTGLRFKLTHDWNGEIAALYGRSDDIQISRQGVNTTVRNAALASSNPATALNPFGGNNPASFPDLFTANFSPNARSTLTSVDASFNGPVLTLPGGEVRLAVGGEYRKEGIFGSLYTGTGAAPIAASHIDATHTITAGFAEIAIPIVSDANAKPGIRRLDFTVAGRVEHYSDFGDTTNPRYGVNWSPVLGLTLKASYGTSFRAPQLSESYLKSIGWGIYPINLVDPTAPSGRTPGFSLAGGNPNLKPETATTWTIGAEFNPEWLRGFTATVTYFDIEYVNQINQLQGNGTVLQNNFYAAYVIRNPTQAQINSYLNPDGSPAPINGALPATIGVILDGRRNNLGGTIMKGFDVTARYRWTWEEVGDFDAGVNLSNLTDLHLAPSPSAAFVDVRGQINQPATFRGRADATWRRGPASIGLSASYTNSYTNNLVTPFFKVDSWTTLDVDASYDFTGLQPWTENLRATVNVRNLLNTDPPFSNSGTGYDPQMATAIGRLVALTLDKRF